MRSSPRLACLALLAAACLPDDAPYWLIDHPMNWGIRVSVTQPGGYSTGLVVPEGQVRAVPMPLDTIELEWLTVAPTEVELAPPIWIVCSLDCGFEFYYGSFGMIPTCELPLSARASPKPCRIGEGQRLSVTLAGLYAGGVGPLSLLAVGSGSDEVDPETCLQRLMGQPRAGLESCLVMSRGIVIGTNPGTGLPSPDGPFMPPPDTDPTPGQPIPPEVLAQPPDTHPIVAGFTVVRQSGEEVAVAEGGAVQVRPGERLEVSIEIDPDTVQTYFDQRIVAGVLRWTEVEEGMSVEAGVTLLVEEWEYVYEGPTRSFRVPEDAGPFTMHWLVSDGRQGRAAASLRFVPEGMSETP